jgi:hypothetical protein
VKPNDRIRCIKRASDDIAQSFVQRYGTIVSRKRSEDGVKMYKVKMDCRVDPIFLWEDEMVVVKRKPKRN